MSTDHKSVITPIPGELAGTTMPTTATSSLPMPMEVSLSQKIAIFAIIVGSVLTAFSSPAFILAGVLLTALGTAMPLVWSDKEEILQEISKRARDLLDDGISDTVLTLANTTARKLNHQCDELRLALKQWHDSKQTQGAGHVRSLFSSFAAGYPTETWSLVQGNYRATLLPMYVEASWKYLALMRCIYDDADALEIGSRGFLSPQALVLDYIKRNTILFCNEANKSYEFGLLMITRNHENPDLGQRRPTWLDYNDYRNLMTLTALDLLASFIYFNPELYPERTSVIPLNRRLLTCLVTRQDQEWRNNMHKLQIGDFEGSYNRTTPVYQLYRLDFASAHTVTEGIEVDGLTYVRSSVQSLDGWEHSYQLLPNGKIYEGNAVTWRSFDQPIFRAEGNYLLGRHPSDGGAKQALRLMTKLLLYAEGTQNVTGYQMIFSSSTAEQASFSQSIPVIPSSTEEPDPSKHSHQLAAFQMAWIGSTDHPAFLFRWFLKDGSFPAPDNLQISADQPIKLHQFFAVRAAGSIWESDLGVVPGAHFQGGDAVSVPTDGQLNFRVNDLKAWTSGFYRVRIWYFRSVSPRLALVSLIPTGNFPTSTILLDIPSAEKNADYMEPMFEDLIYFTSPAIKRVFVRPDMAPLELSFVNISPQQSIIVDRIELIFDAEATIQANSTP